METTSTFESTRENHKIFCRSWLVDQPKAVVYIHHGLHEHCGRYDELAKRFNSSGIQVHGYDARGHGRTVEMNQSWPKGHMGDWNTVKSDLNDFVSHFPSAKPAIYVLSYFFKYLNCSLDIHLEDYGYSNMPWKQSVPSLSKGSLRVVQSAASIPFFTL
jgi:hypothetical protein